MMKYVALLNVDKPERWGHWHGGPTAQYYKSPIETDKRKAEKWLEEELKKYPDATINGGPANREFFIRTTVIAFDDNETKDFEGFLEHGMVFLN